MTTSLPKIASQDKVPVDDSGCGCFSKKDKKKTIPREPAEVDLTVRVRRASSGQFDAMPPLEKGNPLQRSTPINLDVNGHRV